ncbi:MAG: DNA repair protein RadC [Gammaproteobacteria bacterium]|nr:DNA repair protein RadC [Gammaproteobacteria bacterium]
MNVRLSKDQKIKIGSPEDIYAIMQKILLRENRLGRAKEHFWVIGLTFKHQIAYIELVSLGSISAAIVTPLEIFSLAVSKKSPKVVLVHNHPSGSLEPSKVDRALTEKIVAGGKILEVAVLDHLIISETGYYSFAQHQLL